MTYKNYRGTSSLCSNVAILNLLYFYFNWVVLLDSFAVVLKQSDILKFLGFDWYSLSSGS